MNRASRPPSRWTSLALLSMVLLLAACTARSATKGKIAGADAQPGAVPDIVGSYSVNGEDPIGTEYGGNLTIKPGASPTEYLLQWIVTGSIQEGSGKLDGNKLRVEWRTVEGIKPSGGVTTYTITTKRELYGDRSVVGFPKTGTENAFPNPEPKNR
jgi:hypothetical protein